MTSPTVVCGQWLRTSLCGVASAMLVACTALPHIGHSTYDDAWGERGPDVYARDLAWCVAAAESRRSLVGGCMFNRGWVPKTGA